MPLIYSLVSRGTTVLAEYSAFSGNFNTVAVECLQNLKNPESRFTITADRHTFNFLIHGQYTYLVVADEAYGRQIPFGYLARLKDEFETSFADKAWSLPANSLDSSFGSKMKALMKQCMEHPEDLNKMASVQKQVAEVKGIMVQNVEKVLEREQHLNILSDRTDDLQDQASKFQHKGKQLRKKMWWQLRRMQLLLILGVIVLAIIIFCLICFSGGKSCV